MIRRSSTAAILAVLARPAAVVVLAAVATLAALAGPAQAAPLLNVELLGHYPSGRQPTALTLVDEGRGLLVTNRGDSTVDLFDADTLERRQHYAIDSVGHGVWDGQVVPGRREIVVANWVGESLTVFDRESGAVTAIVPTGIKPSYLALSPDGQRAYAAGFLTGDLTIVDLTARKPLRTIEVGQKPMGVACSPDGRFLYVASCASRKVSKLDLKYDVVISSFGVPLAETTNLAITADGRHVVAAGDHGRVLLIDTETGDTRKLRVGGEIAAVELSPDGSTAFVAVHDLAQVAILDLVSGEVTERLATGPGPIDVATDGRRLWTANDRADSITAWRLSPVEPIDLPTATTPR
jgi:sugar lactone lactonase YvrE